VNARKAKPSFGPSLAGLQVVRCQSLPATFEHEDVRWTIDGIPVNTSEAKVASAAALGIYGELFVHSTQAVIGVTVQGFLDYEDDGDPSPLFHPDRDKALAAFTPFAEHYGEALWDIAADTARVLAALTRSDVTVPIKAPEPDSVTITRSNEEAEADAAAVGTDRERLHESD